MFSSYIKRIMGADNLSSTFCNKNKCRFVAAWPGGVAWGDHARRPTRRHHCLAIKMRAAIQLPNKQQNRRRSPRPIISLKSCLCIALIPHGFLACFAGGCHPILAGFSDPKPPYLFASKVPPKVTQFQRVTSPQSSSQVVLNQTNGHFLSHGSLSICRFNDIGVIARKHGC